MSTLELSLDRDRSQAGAFGLLALLLSWSVWLLIGRVGVDWYLFVLLWPAARSLLSSAAHVALVQPAPDLARPPLLELYPLPPELAAVGWWTLLPAIVLQQQLLSSPLDEEIGWRGYALPRLQTRTSPLAASVWLGLLWSVWHLPLYVTLGHPLFDQSLVWLPLGLIPTTILFTWVYNQTGGSLLLALLFHAAINITDLVLAETTTLPLISPALSWLAALLVIGTGRLAARRQRQATPTG